MVQFSDKRQISDAAIIPFWHGKKGAVRAADVKEFDAFVKPVLQAGDFTGRADEVFFVYLPGRKKEKKLLLLGLGSKDTATAESFRRAYGAATKAALQKNCKSLNIFFGEGFHHKALTEGLLLANYAFHYKEKPSQLITKMHFVGADRELMTELREVASVIQAVNETRDLINGNADDVTPQHLTQKAKELAKEFSSIHVTALGKKEIEKEKMGLLLAVNRGAAQEPALITLEYRGDPDSKELTAVVGKGITFDTGGLNLKPTGGIETMKDDMSAAAAVLGILRSLATLKMKVNVIGVIASTENAIGPMSYKPGDVYKSHAGITVEIANTDAEGRLVLADALSYVQKKHKPTRLIDMATLTSSVVFALGEEVSGLYSNDDKLADALFQAGQTTHERLWRLPLYKEYRDLLKSPIADMKNAGGKKGGSIIAASFLKDFVGDIPWAHIDIAGTAYLSETKTYHPTYATGVGVRLLLEFFRKMQEK